jgi:hypothetical protein
MIRRVLVILVFAATSLLFGFGSSADAGEICVRVFPSRSHSRICLPTWTLDQ